MQSGTPAENDGITENQLKVYISASDALSGIDRLTADAGGRTYTAEKLANGEYMLTITYAFRGPLVITAYDRAGNSDSVTKSVNVDDEMGDILTGEAVVSYDSATLYGTVTTRDEYLAADGYGIEYRKASDTEWTSALPDAGTAKDGFSVVLNGLTPDTDYVYRTFVRSMANVMHYGEIKTFHTAAAPLTDTEVVSFYLEGQIGDAVISHDDETAGNGGTITVTVPYQTDLEDLSRRLTSAVQISVSPGAEVTIGDISVSADSGTDEILTANVIVTAEDGSSGTYVLTVQAQAAPRIDDSSFESLVQAAGMQTITLSGDNLENASAIEILLIDEFGQTASRASAVRDAEADVWKATINVPENSSTESAAVYTVGYIIDGVQTVTESTITVPEAANSDCALLHFDIQGAESVTVDAITRNITVTMPYDYAAETLSAKLSISRGATYEFRNESGVKIDALPAEGTASLVITAENGTDSVTYTVIVNRQGSGGSGGSGGGGGTSSGGGTSDPGTGDNPEDPDNPGDPSDPENPGDPTDPSGPQEWEDNPFEDVSEADWYFGAVRYVKENGLMQGVSDTSFAPQSNITRGMLVTALYRLEGEPQVQEDAVRFLDVRQNAYYAKAVAWADSADIIKGVSSTLFAPDRNITREQMAAMIWRYYTYKGENTSAEATGSYADYGQISEYARDAVDFCREAGLMTGMENNSFAPKDVSTRAQMAVLLQRMMQSVLK